MIYIFSAKLYLILPYINNKRAIHMNSETRIYYYDLKKGYFLFEISFNITLYGDFTIHLYKLLVNIWANAF